MVAAQDAKDSVALLVGTLLLVGEPQFISNIPINHL